MPRLEPSPDSLVPQPAGGLFILVRGVGEIASAVAHALFRAGFAVAMHEASAPTSCRRRMSFVDAFFDGTARLDEVLAWRVGTLAQLNRLLDSRAAVPLLTMDFDTVLAARRPGVLVDARMRKRAPSGPQRGIAPLSIGIGPGFVAGATVDVVIESAWGDRLGDVLWQGSAQPYVGEPQRVGGYGRERFVYTPHGGLFRSPCQMGDLVQAGDVIGHVGGTALRAPLTGHLRGLTRSGVPVQAGTKVIEVCPAGVEVQM
jgi:xanthine dehydrogenase accessory factor